MRTLVVGWVLAAGCASQHDDLAGVYAVQSMMVSSPCDAAPSPVSSTDTFVFTAVAGGFDITAYTDATRTSTSTTMPAGIPLRTALAGGWSGSVGSVGFPGDLPGCWLQFEATTVLHAGGGLTFDSFHYNERAPSACTADEAARLGATMPCHDRVQIVATPAG